jgi:cytochrome c556
MFTRLLLIPAGIVVCLVCVSLAQKPDPAPKAVTTDRTEKSGESAKGKTPLEAFMRLKLDASSKILEGLCQEDAALVKEGAEALSAMSKVEIWNVLIDPDYREHSREFRENAAQVSKAAQEGDFDKAALRWFDVTMSCLECHDHVRNERKEEKK